MASFFAVQKPASPPPPPEQPFTPEQIAWFHAHSLIACDKTIGNSRSEEINREGLPWRKVKERADLQLKVYTSPASDSPLIIHRAICLFENIEPEHLLSFTQHIDYRLTWDRNTKSLKEIPISDEPVLKNGQTYQRRCLMLRVSSKQVGPISSRDFVDVNMMMTQEDGSIVSAGAGLQPDQTGGHFPVQSDAVRGLNHFWGLHLEKCGVDGKDCKLTYLLHCDLKGWFRPMVINHVAGGFYVSFFQDLKAAMKTAQGLKIMADIRVFHDELHQRLMSTAATINVEKMKTESTAEAVAAALPSTTEVETRETESTMTTARSTTKQPPIP